MFPLNRWASVDLASVCLRFIVHLKMNFLEALKWIVGDAPPTCPLFGKKLSTCHHLDEGKYIPIMAGMVLPPSPYKSCNASSFFCLPLQASLLDRTYEDACRVFCIQAISNLKVATHSLIFFLDNRQWCSPIPTQNPFPICPALRAASQWVSCCLDFSGERETQIHSGWTDYKEHIFPSEQMGVFPYPRGDGTHSRHSSILSKVSSSPTCESLLVYLLIIEKGF